MLLHAVAQNGSYTMKVSIRDVDGRSDVREGSGVATARVIEASVRGLYVQARLPVLCEPRQNGGCEVYMYGRRSFGIYTLLEGIATILFRDRWKQWR